MNDYDRAVARTHAAENALKPYRDRMSAMHGISSVCGPHPWMHTKEFYASVKARAIRLLKEEYKAQLKEYATAHNDEWNVWLTDAFRATVY